MAKDHHEQDLFEKQSTALSQGPVECLGDDVPNDEERRETFPDDTTG